MTMAVSETRLADPQSPDAEEPDRPQLQRIIAGLSEGVILIETDRRILWANEAALAMHGVHATADLGGSVDGYVQRFRLERRDRKPLATHDYPAERLCRGEEFSDLVVHLADPGEPTHDWFHKVRGIELRDDAGRPDCFALVISDATEAFEAEERFQRMFSANPAPALILRTPDLRYVRVNEGFLEMTGYRREDIVGKSLYDFDILGGAERKEIAKAELNGWRTVPQMEAELQLPDGGSKLVIMAGHPVEFGVSRCMIFTFADLEPKRRAETALRQSEEQFAKAFRLAPVPMTLSALDGHQFLDVNHAFLQLTGWSYEAVIGRRPGEIEMWESSATRRQVEQLLADRGSLKSEEARLKTRTGELVDCLVSAETATLRGEPCVMAVFQDITERKRTETELIAAIEAAMQDSSWLSRKIMDKLAQLRSPRPDGAAPPAEPADLTLREREVLGLLAEGRSDNAVAEALSLSRHTVRNHVARLYAKIGVHSRSEAVVWARDRGHAPAKKAQPKSGK